MRGFGEWLMEVVVFPFTILKYLSLNISSWLSFTINNVVLFCSIVGEVHKKTQPTREENVELSIFVTSRTLFLSISQSSSFLWIVKLKRWDRGEARDSIYIWIWRFCYYLGFKFPFPFLWSGNVQSKTEHVQL